MKTRLKTKQFLFNIISLSCTDTFHFSLSPIDKFAVSFAKRSSSSYKQTFTKFFQWKKPFLSLTSKYLNQNCCPWGCFQACDFSVSSTLHIPIFCQHVIMKHLVTDPSLGTRLQSSGLRPPFASFQSYLRQTGQSFFSSWQIDRSPGNCLHSI